MESLYKQNLTSSDTPPGQRGGWMVVECNITVNGLWLSNI